MIEKPDAVIEPFAATEKIGGWKTKKSTVVYDNPWIQVRHEEVVMPRGAEGIYGVVHFKNIAVGVLPLDDEGNTWLVKQTRYALNLQTWEIPEGGCPSDERPIDAARRELEEEAGLIAADISHLMTMHSSNSVTDEVCEIFIARNLSQGKQQLDETEDISVKKLPLKEAIAMVKRGEITDAMSIAALLAVASNLYDVAIGE